MMLSMLNIYVGYFNSYVNISYMLNCRSVVLVCQAFSTSVITFLRVLYLSIQIRSTQFSSGPHHNVVKKCNSLSDLLIITIVSYQTSQLLQSL